MSLVLVIDEYLAVRVVRGDWPDELPDDDVVLPASRHWRLLQAVHSSRGGQLSQLIAALSTAGRDAIRHPHPEVLEILDPRPLLDGAAAIAGRYGWMADRRDPRGRRRSRVDALVRHRAERRRPGPPRHTRTRDHDTRRNVISWVFDLNSVDAFGAILVGVEPSRPD